MCWIERHTARCGCVWDSEVKKCTIAEANDDEAPCEDVIVAPMGASPWTKVYCPVHEDLRRYNDARDLTRYGLTEHNFGFNSRWAKWLRITGYLKDEQFTANIELASPFQVESNEGLREEEQALIGDTASTSMEI